LTVIAREVFKDLYDDLGEREDGMATVEQAIRTLGSEHDVVRRLQTVPGIGYLSATALFAGVGDAKQYQNGRQLAAWIGLVPRQSSSGGKPRLLGITKRGDKYLRKLLVHGARAITTRAETNPSMVERRARTSRQTTYVCGASEQGSSHCVGDHDQRRSV
jgi:transposase